MARKKSFWKKNKLFFLGLSIGLIFIVGALVGIRLSIDTSVVNQLQHYTQSVRTNDMFNPIIVYDDNGFLEIEITLPHLTEIDDADGADMFVSYWRIANPISSVYDWYDRGVFIDDFLIWGEELDSYCDNPDPTNTWYTHFYRLWNVPDLDEGFTYAIYLDFYDADDNFWVCDNPFMPFGEGGEPALQLLIDEPPPEEEVQAWLLDCDFISFFEYQESSAGETVPPTGTPTGGTGDTGSGPEAGGWVNQYTIFDGMQNWVFLLILVLVFGIIGLIIFFILYVKWKGKKKK